MIELSNGKNIGGVTSRSEVKDTNIHGTLTGLPIQNQNSLTNSFKKSQAASQQNSDSRTRSFQDVLKAMRNTEELEEEKRMRLLQ